MRPGVLLTMSLLSLLLSPFTSSADWRGEADARIAKHRRGRMIVSVLDTAGNPVPGAAVRAELTNHEFWFGTALARKMFDEKTDPKQREQYLSIAREYFNSAVHENALKWYSTERRQGQVRYDDADRMLAWCEENGLRMRGHCLFWEVEKFAQDWIKALPDDALLRVVRHRAREVPERYRGRILEYDVNNEMLHGDFYRKRLGEGIYAEMFRIAHEADPSALLYVNDFQILNGVDIERYKEQIRGFLDAGVPLGGIGCQGHFGNDIPGPEVLYERLDSLAEFGLPIKVTEFDLSTTDEERKAKCLEEFYRVCFSHPAVSGILMWGFWEGAHWRPDAALFDREFEPRPAALVFHDLVHKEWHTDIRGHSKANGLFTFQGYFGDYRLTATLPDGVTIEQTAVLPSSKKTPTTVTIQEGK